MNSFQVDSAPWDLLFLLFFFIFSCITELASATLFPEGVTFDGSRDFGDPWCIADGVRDGSSSITSGSGAVVDDLQFSRDFFFLPARWSARGKEISLGREMFGLPASGCSCDAYEVPKGLYRTRSPSGCFLFFLTGYLSWGWNSKYICLGWLASDPLSFVGRFIISCKWK